MATTSVVSQTLQTIALSLLQYTPRLALLDQNSLALEVSASLSLFHGPRHLWRRIHATLRNLGVNIRAGMAPSAQGARLLAHQTHTRLRRTLQIRTLTHRLNPLPLHLIPTAQTHLSWLNGIGCHTLGQARQLPRAGLQQRSSPLLLQALDQAYAVTACRFTWFQAPQGFSQHYELTERLEHSNAVLAVSKRLLEQLCGWLQANHTAASTIELHLHHEKGRHARPATVLTLRLSQDGWLLQDFLPPLDLRLQNLALAAPVIAVQLSVTDTRPRPSVSRELFPQPSHWQRQEKQMQDLLRARLGDDSIQHATPVASYLPEQANQWTCVSEASGMATTHQVPPQLPATARPFWLLPDPLALSTKNNRPIYKNQPLRLIQGPERIESGWWQEPGHQQRDYFIAQSPDFMRYWIFQLREADYPSWFLHGLFA